MISRHFLFVLSTVGPEHHLQTQKVVCEQHTLLSSAAVLRPCEAVNQVQLPFQPFFCHCFSHSFATISAILPPLFQPYIAFHIQIIVLYLQTYKYLTTLHFTARWTQQTSVLTVRYSTHILTYRTAQYCLSTLIRGTCSVLFQRIHQRNMLSTVSAYVPEAHVLLC